MKLKVTFRGYTPPYVDPETKEEERGDFLGSFDEEIEGENTGAILAAAQEKAAQYSERDGNDVRVWETAVAVTPRGIKSV